MASQDDEPSAFPTVEAEDLFMKFVEANGYKDIDPLSDEALRLQSRYGQTIGKNPFDILKSLSANPFVPPSSRIAAAKALLEYTARKVPAQLELTGRDGGAVKIDPAVLGKLSAKELSQLEQLLLKAQGTKS